MPDDLVLVTGGSGFVASYCIARLLKGGYRVRTTVRSEGREWQVREQVATAGSESGPTLTFVEADLIDDQGWDAAVAGCRYVLHVASPFPLDAPADENDLIEPAVQGTLRVLRAATAAGVERVVLTSSFAAIGYSPRPPGHVYTEQDWTDPDTPGLSAYVKSKTLAERAAWDYVESTEDSPELTVINPTGVFGPVLGPRHPTSIELIAALLRRAMPLVPKLWFAVVDVRDLAELHVKAMTDPEAAGWRFLAAGAPPVSLRDVARLIKLELGDRAERVPTWPMPSRLVRLLARVVPRIRPLVGELGVIRLVDNAQARTVLGWRPRPTEDTVLATARSLIALNADERSGSPLGSISAVGMIPRS